jgi:uncharacterized protein
MTVEPELTAFAKCWNDGAFFTAHEVLEGLWMRRRDDGLQGLIQLAVALHHIERGNIRGARTMIERARRHLSNEANAPCPIDLTMMDDYAARVAEALADGNMIEIVASRPKIKT